MASNSNPTVGVVNAPVVAQALRELGFRVVSAEGFRDAATLVSTELKTSSFPVVVGESDATGVGPWVTSTAAKTSVVLLVTRPDLGISTTGAHRLDTPATLNDVLPLIGYQASMSETGETAIPREVPAPVSAPLPLPLPTAAAPQPLPLPLPDTQHVAPAPITREPAHAMPAGLFDDIITPPAPAVAQVFTPGTPAGLFDNEPVVETATFVPPVAHVAPAPTYVPLPVAPAAPSVPEQAYNHPVGAATPPPAPVRVEADPHHPAPIAQMFSQTQPAADDDDMFDRRASRPIAGAAPVTVAANGKKGELLIFFAGKGGVGKTSQAMFAAKTASQAGLRVTLVDGNRGQADIGTNLRFPKRQLPTIYDSVRTGDPAAGLLLPDQYNRQRPTAVEPLDFAIVQGPPASLADPSIVSAEEYAKVIDYARGRSDLVILDTQIAEAHKTDLFDRLIIPAMISGAWSVAIVNESRAGADNLLERLQEFQERGVTNARTLILASLYEEFDDADRVSIERKYGRYGSFIGSAGVDRAVKNQMNLGNLLTDSPSVAPATRAILHRVTGNPVFSPAEPPRRRGLFGRKRA